MLIPRPMPPLTTTTQQSETTSSSSSWFGSLLNRTSPSSSPSASSSSPPPPFQLSSTRVLAITPETVLGGDCEPPPLNRKVLDVWLVRRRPPKCLVPGDPSTALLRTLVWPPRRCLLVQDGGFVAYDALKRQAGQTAALLLPPPSLDNSGGGGAPPSSSSSSAAVAAAEATALKDVGLARHDHGKGTWHVLTASLMTKKGGKSGKGGGATGSKGKGRGKAAGSGALGARNVQQAPFNVKDGDLLAVVGRLDPFADEFVGSEQPGTVAAAAAAAGAKTATNESSGGGTEDLDGSAGGGWLSGLLVPTASASSPATSFQQGVASEGGTELEKGLWDAACSGPSPLLFDTAADKAARDTRSEVEEAAALSGDKRQGGKQAQQHKNSGGKSKKRATAEVALSLGGTTFNWSDSEDEDESDDNEE